MKNSTSKTQTIDNELYSSLFIYLFIIYIYYYYYYLFIYLFYFFGGGGLMLLAVPLFVASGNVSCCQIHTFPPFSQKE